MYNKEPINNKSLKFTESYFAMRIDTRISNKIDSFLLRLKFTIFFFGIALREGNCVSITASNIIYNLPINKVVKKQIFFYCSLSIVLQLKTRICSLNELKTLYFQENY